MTRTGVEREGCHLARTELAVDRATAITASARRSRAVCARALSRARLGVPW